MYCSVSWAASCENVSPGICAQRRARSACASAQSDQGLHCPLTESLNTTECMNGAQRTGRNFAQDDVNLLFLHVLEGNFFA